MWTQILDLDGGMDPINSFFIVWSQMEMGLGYLLQQIYHDRSFVDLIGSWISRHVGSYSSICIIVFENWTIDNPMDIVFLAFWIANNGNVFWIFIPNNDRSISHLSMICIYVTGVCFPRENSIWFKISGFLCVLFFWSSLVCKEGVISLKA